MVFKFFAYETQSLRTEWDDEKSIMDPRVQHLSYIFEETGETIEIFQNPKSEYTKTLIRAIPTVTDEEDATKP